MNSRSMNLTYHNCGGAILSAVHSGESYDYCDMCRAFGFDSNVPTGIDFRENQEAWDSGETQSPEAHNSEGV